MSNYRPIIRQISIISLIINVFIILIFSFISYQFDKTNYLTLGIFAFLILSLILRYTITYNHRIGMMNYKKRKYKEGIEYFEKSYNYFVKYKWVDKYRSITVLSSTKIPYGEMALINIAYCNVQLGNKEKAKEIYKKVIIEYGSSEIAETALKMME